MNTHILHIDRSKPFDVDAFMYANNHGKGWKIDWQDKKSLYLEQLDLTKVKIVTVPEDPSKYSSVARMHFPGRNMTGEYRIQQLHGRTLLDAKVLQTLLENPQMIPSAWKEASLSSPGRGESKVSTIHFDGTILLTPGGERSTLYLCSIDGGAWYVNSFFTEDIVGPAASAVL